MKRGIGARKKDVGLLCTQVGLTNQVMIRVNQVNMKAKQYVKGRRL